MVSVKSAGSSVDKGESLKDTVATLSATTRRRSCPLAARGAAGLVARWTDASVINAGDGKHEHPTQALLDVFTLRSRLGSLDGIGIWIVGDVLHSRVARSCLLAFQKLERRGDAVRPPTLIPREIEALGCGSPTTSTEWGRPTSSTRSGCSASADGELRPFASGVREPYQIDSRRLGPRQLLMHPGPVNRGVELAPEVIDSPQSLITAQVESGSRGQDGDPLRAPRRQRSGRAEAGRRPDTPTIGQPA